MDYDSDEGPGSARRLIEGIRAGCMAASPKIPKHLGAPCP